MAVTKAPSLNLSDAAEARVSHDRIQAMAGRGDPAALGIRARIRAGRSGSGHAALAHCRAALDPVRPDARRAAERGRADPV
jgi:hypothetical protein